MEGEYFRSVKPAGADPLGNLQLGKALIKIIADGDGPFPGQFKVVQLVHQDVEVALLHVDRRGANQVKGWLGVSGDLVTEGQKTDIGEGERPYTKTVVAVGIVLKCIEPVGSQSGKGS